MSQTTANSECNLVDLFASSARPKQWVERRIAEMAQGVVASLRDGALTVGEAREELFSLDNLQAIRRRRLSPHLVELFSWGMELATVGKLSPETLPESFDQITRLARLVIQRPPSPRRTGIRSNSPPRAVRAKSKSA